MAQQENKPIAGDIKVKIEMDINIKEEQPDFSAPEENVVAVGFIKPERIDPAEPDTEGKDVISKVDHKSTENKCVCVVCNRGFATNQRLNIHFKSVHLNVTTYKCQDCNAAFTEVSKLNRHRSMHRNYVCEQCGRSFGKLDSLNGHLLTCVLHHNLETVTSGECYQAFTNTTLSKQHIVGVHHIMKEHQCLKCNKTFATRSYLNRHVDGVHRKLKPFDCQECNRSYSQQCHLDQHINTVHRKIKRFVCGGCDHSFADRRHLINHIKSHNAVRQPR